MTSTPNTIDQLDAEVTIEDTTYWIHGYRIIGTDTLVFGAWERCEATSHGTIRFRDHECWGDVTSRSISAEAAAMVPGSDERIERCGLERALRHGFATGLVARAFPGLRLNGRHECTVDEFVRATETRDARDESNRALAARIAAQGEPF